MIYDHNKKIQDTANRLINDAVDAMEVNLSGETRQQLANIIALSFRQGMVYAIDSNMRYNRLVLKDLVGDKDE